MSRLAMFASVTLALFMGAGCVAYKGAKVVEGTDLAVGFNIPSSEGALQFQLLNYLSGFRLGIEQGAGLDMSYTCDSTTTYFGVVDTHKVTAITAKVRADNEEAPKTPLQATDTAGVDNEPPKPAEGLEEPFSRVSCDDKGVD